MRTSQQELDQNDRLTVLAFATICVPVGTAVVEQNQVQVGSEVYTVLSVDADPSGFNLLIPLKCVAVT